MRNRRTKLDRSVSKGHRDSDRLLVPAARGAACSLASGAVAAAADAEALGYLLGCLQPQRPLHARGAHGQPDRQLQLVLESAIKQAFPPSSSLSASKSRTLTSVLTTLRGQWLNSTAVLLDSSNKKDWGRNPADLARVLHRLFHLSPPSGGRGAAKVPRAALGGGGIGHSRGGGSGGRPTTRTARASGYPARISSRCSPPTALTLLRSAPMGTLECTVLEDSDLDGGAALNVVIIGTDTATSCSSASGSSSDEDDAFGRGAQFAALLAEGGIEAIQHHLYRRFVEALHLEVVGRTPSVLGGRSFQVYPLAGGTVRPVMSLQELRGHVEHEFYALQCGTSRRRSASGQTSHVAKDCRVYACRPPKSSTLLWVQVHIGSSSSSATIGTAKKGSTTTKSGSVGSRHSEVVYHIVLQEGVRHVAVASSWGPDLMEAGSTSPVKGAVKELMNNLQWILAALDLSVTTVADRSSTPVASRKKKIHVYRSVDSLSGPDPLDLLRTSATMTDRTAMGRFRMYDAQLQKVGTVTPSTLDGIVPDKATMHRPHPRDHRPSIVSRIEDQGFVLQHSSLAQLDRKRSHVQHFGRPEDCPKRRRIRWDVEQVHSTAATAAVLVSSLPQQCHHITQITSLPTTPIKCRVVLQGPDVIEGLRAMMEAGDLGICESRHGSAVLIPSCVRDVPSSSHETIKVVNGAVVLS